jgi:hypothetical protein
MFVVRQTYVRLWGVLTLNATGLAPTSRFLDYFFRMQTFLSLSRSLSYVCANDRYCCACWRGETTPDCCRHYSSVDATISKGWFRLLFYSLSLSLSLSLSHITINLKTLTLIVSIRGELKVLLALVVSC